MNLSIHDLKAAVKRPVFVLPMSKLREYIEEEYPPKKQEEIRVLMGWSKYQWTWHLNNTERWERHTIMAWAHSTGTNFDELIETYELGSEKLKAA